jgi:two-component system, LytTR family, sensor kinase
MIDIFGDSRHLAVNTLGHVAGVLIFGIFLTLVFSQRTFPQLRASRLSLAGAALALIWNLASLFVLLVGPSNSSMERIIAGAGFCALSLLPSVLLDLSLANRFPIIVRCGYLLSFCAAFAHFTEFFYDSARFHRLGLAAITIGFGLLTVVSVLMVLWSGGENPRALSMRILSAMSLFLFAVSFVHFSDGKSSEAWVTELVMHHGGIPLALFVIMQDYRFVFLDAFLRLVLNVSLAGIFALFIAIYSPRLPFPTQVLCVSAALAAFAFTKGFLQRLLTKLVFRQPDTESALWELRELGALATDEDSYIHRAAEYIAKTMNAELCSIPPEMLPRSVNSSFPTLIGTEQNDRILQECGVEVIVPIGYSQGDKRYVSLGARRGGRRYLSEDLQVFARMAACIREQLEHIRNVETQRLVSEAELRALQAQIHPHFLFNAFNTLYGIIPRQASGARRMVLNLSEIFRYFLQTERTFVSLDEELRIVRAYLAIEELRLQDKLQINIDLDDDVSQELVPMLSIQPLVENAIKHGVATRPEGGAIRIRAHRDGDRLHVQVQDTGPGFSASLPKSSRDGAGVGLANVSRRLVLCYGPEADLQVESGTAGTTVSFAVPCERPRASHSTGQSNPVPHSESAVLSHGPGRRDSNRANRAARRCGHSCEIPG